MKVLEESVVLPRPQNHRDSHPVSPTAAGKIEAVSQLSSSGDPVRARRHKEILFCVGLSLGGDSVVFYLGKCARLGEQLFSHLGRPDSFRKES